MGIQEERSERADLDFFLRRKVLIYILIYVKIREKGGGRLAKIVY